MFLKDFQEMVDDTKSPKSVQSPEMIRESCGVPELFQVTEASSFLFCPGQTGQSKQKTEHVFEAFPGMFPKMQHAKAFVREISAMSKCQLMKRFFAFSVRLLCQWKF